MVNKILTTSTFENEMCLKCRNLAICGGLCFNRRMNLMNCSEQPSCVKAKLETGVDSYVKEYYNMRLKKRQETKLSAI